MTDTPERPLKICVTDPRSATDPRPVVQAGGVQINDPDYPDNILWLNPTQARSLSDDLIQAANRAEWEDGRYLDDWQGRVPLPRAAG